MENLTELLAAAARKLGDIETREACENSLLDFTAAMWPIIDPGQPFVSGYALEAICAHLEAVHFGHIKRLLITVPPGCTKSTLCSVMYPIWVWGPRREPFRRFINASYAESLSLRDNLRARRIVSSEMFQSMWPLALTQPATAINFQNEQTGWKYATSVSGALTGYRGDCIILDDPNNPQEVESEAVRRSTNQWLTEVVPTRLNNMDLGSIILMQQRVHMEDAAGTWIKRGMAEVHLNLPMEYEPRAYVNAYMPDSDQIQTLVDDDARNVSEDDVFWRDWRSEPGELLWPERFSASVVAKLSRDLGPTATAAQLQQMPVPRGGAIIKTDFWRLWKEPQYGLLDYILATVDTAYTDDERNDPSAMTIWGVKKDQYGNPQIILMYAWQDFLGFHELIDKIILTCTVDQRQLGMLRFPVDRVIIENKAAGISAAQELGRLAGQSGAFGVDLFTPRGDKVARLHAVEHIFASGMVYAPSKDWAEEVIDQVASFPYTSHDDYVDCTSMAMAWLRGVGFTPTREETDADLREELRFKGRLPPLYPC